jgi:hypothetical protein
MQIRIVTANYCPFSQMQRCGARVYMAKVQRTARSNQLRNSAVMTPNPSEEFATELRVETPSLEERVLLTLVSLYTQSVCLLQTKEPTVLSTLTAGFDALQPTTSAESLKRSPNFRTCSKVRFRSPDRNIETALSEPNSVIRSRWARFCRSRRSRTTETGSAP